MIGKLLDHRYQVVRVLATGGFGQTYIAQDTRRPGNPICVVKHLKGANSDPKIFETAKRLFQSEAETLEKLGNHDQIPRLLAYFDENKEFYLVQEFIEGHTLSEELIPSQRWSESEVIQMLLEVLNILEFVHREGVIHRDIKPDNIIRRTSDHKLVLVDFGAVKQLRSPNLTFAGQTTATVAIGTPGYMPTEQGQGKPRPNSDIYSLGIIAIQALTGVAPMNFQEDPDTGEIVWQHLAPVSPELAAVLSKMVRYHFKDRYNSVMQALLSLQLLSSVPSKVQEYAKTPSSYQTVKPTSQMSGQQTIALAPGNHAAKSARKDNKPDLLPLVIAALLAGGAAAVATNLVGSAKNIGFNFASNGAASPNICEAVVTGNSNIRSEPSAINSDNIVQTLSDNTSFEVTGKRTKLGWVQVKLDSGKLAWANSRVIANPEQWVSCLRDKSIAIKTVNDSDLIAARPIPQPIAKVADVTSLPKLEKPELLKSEKPDPFTVEPFTANDKSKNKENGSQVAEQAREKYDKGDLAGAIALLKSLPANASSSWNETAGTVTQWQQDWAKAEALSNEINKALDNGQWDKVLAYKEHPEKLPNIQYWRNKIDPLFKQASENLAKQELPKISKPHQLNQRQHQVETFQRNLSTEESDNVDSETTTETDENGF
ncbi:MAG: protein kinase [Tolypothrix brevis GSE-NOS-MK-07-07A]|jgi:serine/threonine-protein kinase|nr:protein kinase [Tolypothrix brevis GSE-NOS-MK-07-07A]